MPALRRGLNAHRLGRNAAFEHEVLRVALHLRLARRPLQHHDRRGDAPAVHSRNAAVHRVVDGRCIDRLGARFRHTDRKHVISAEIVVLGAVSAHNGVLARLVGKPYPPRRRRRVGLAARDPGGVKPEAVVVDLGKQRVDDREKALAHVPVLPRFPQRQIRRRQQHILNAGAQQKALDRVRVLCSGCNVALAALLDAPALHAIPSVIALAAVHGHAVAADASGHRGHGEDPQRRFHAVE